MLIKMMMTDDDDNHYDDNNAGNYKDYEIYWRR